jgi:FkbM family methyltransferase
MTVTKNFMLERRMNIRLLIKHISRKVFYFLGFRIVLIEKEKYTTEVGIGAKKLEEEYFKNEGQRFAWLKEYDFKNIIDVGANEGQFAKKILTIFPHAQVHCFEPLTEIFEQLKFNFKGMPNIFFYNYGIGKINEEKLIFKNEYSPSSSILEMDDLHRSNFGFAIDVSKVQISLRRLDDFFQSGLSKPVLLKIDVQGYEKFVLEGGENVMSQTDVIIIETSFYTLYKGQPLFDDIYKYLTILDFQYVGNVEQLLATADSKILQADAIFVRKGDSEKTL